MLIENFLNVWTMLQLDYYKFKFIELIDKI